MNKEIRISVALPTRNRPASLERTLQSIRSQRMQPCEIVISDDSTESFKEEVRRISVQYGCRYIDGPKGGLYANRNRVALACLGTHVRTMDDDHTFSEDHFETVYAAVVDNPEVVWTTGERLLVNGVQKDYTSYASQLRPVGDSGLPKNLDDNWAIADGSTVYPMDVFRRGLLFAEQFRYGQAYLEYGIYLYHHGIRSRCIRNCVVEHNVDEEGWASVVEHNVDEEGWASLVSRSRSIDGLRSAAFASFCYNAFFRRNRAAFTRNAIRWTIHLARFHRRPDLIVEAWQAAKYRWAGLGC